MILNKKQKDIVEEAFETASIQPKFNELAALVSQHGEPVSGSQLYTRWYNSGYRLKKKKTELNAPPVSTVERDDTVVESESGRAHQSVATTAPPGGEDEAKNIEMKRTAIAAYEKTLAALRAQPGGLCLRKLKLLSKFQVQTNITAEEVLAILDNMSDDDEPPSSSEE